MDFNKIIQELENASIFDLHRLDCAMSKMMEDPNKIAVVKKQLKVNMPVSYFDKEENRLVCATVLEIKRTRVLVLNHEDNKKWNLPFNWLNLQHVDTDIKAVNTGLGSLNKTNLKVDDVVGWISSRDNEDMFGVVIKLNHKKAKIRRSNQEVWTVPYQMLFPVIEGEQHRHSNLLIEGEIIQSRVS